MPVPLSGHLRLRLPLRGRHETTNEFPAPHSLRSSKAIQPPRDDAERIEPVLVRRGPRQAERPTSRSTSSARRCPTIQTTLASIGSSQAAQLSVSSMRLMAVAEYQ
jgi:hypothetical protein